MNSKIIWRDISTMSHGIGISRNEKQQNNSTNTNMLVTVQNLLDELNKVQDKSMPILVQTNNYNAMRVIKPASQCFETEVCVRDAKKWFKDTDKSKAFKIVCH